MDGRIDGTEIRSGAGVDPNLGRKPAPDPRQCGLRRELGLHHAVRRDAQRLAGAYLEFELLQRDARVAGRNLYAEVLTGDGDRGQPGGVTRTAVTVGSAGQNTGQPVQALLVSELEGKVGVGDLNRPQRRKRIAVPDQLH